MQLALWHFNDGTDTGQPCRHRCGVGFAFQLYGTLGFFDMLTSINALMDLHDSQHHSEGSYGAALFSVFLLFFSTDV